MNPIPSTPAVPPASHNLVELPLQFLKGIGPVKAKLLERLELFTVQDLLFHFPTEHRDRATITPIRAATAGQPVNFVAQIVDVTAKRFNGKEQVKAVLHDAAGDSVDAVWWTPWIAERLTPFGWGFFTGKNHELRRSETTRQSGI